MPREPRNIGASVRARLLDRARAERSNFQILLTRYWPPRLRRWQGDRDCFVVALPEGVLVGLIYQRILGGEVIEHLPMQLGDRLAWAQRGERFDGFQVLGVHPG